MPAAARKPSICWTACGRSTATSLPADNGTAAMDRHADWHDTFWCLAYTLASLGGWLWLYWDMTYPAQQLL
jgi:hypothetical protein